MNSTPEDDPYAAAVAKPRGVSRRYLLGLFFADHPLLAGIGLLLCAVAVLVMIPISAALISDVMAPAQGRAAIEAMVTGNTRTASGRVQTTVSLTIRNASKTHGMSTIIGTFSIPGQTVRVSKASGKGAYPVQGGQGNSPDQVSFYDIHPGARTTATIILLHLSQATTPLSAHITLTLTSQRTFLPSPVLGRVTFSAK